MANKTIKTRNVQKHDTEANWIKAVNFVPLKGELIVYDVDQTHLTPRLKIGDGVTKVNDLDFQNEEVDLTGYVKGSSLTADRVILGNNGSNIKTSSYSISSSLTSSTTTITTASAIKAAIDAKYTKPSGGIPKTDLASTVQASLNKADSALQSVPVASNTAIGGIQTGYTLNSAQKNYPVQLSGNKAYVHVPWTDTNTTYDVATTTKNGLLPKLSGSTTQFLRGDGTWVVPYQLATASSNGLLSSADKVKLDSIGEIGNGTITIKQRGTVAGTFTLNQSGNETIELTDYNTIYTHPTFTARNLGFYKIQVNNQGHVIATSNVAKTDITNLGIPAQDTTYTKATTTADGLMSKEDKS